MKLCRQLFSCLAVVMLAASFGCQPPAAETDVDVSTSTSEGSGTESGSGSSNVTTGVETPSSNVTTGTETP